MTDNERGLCATTAAWLDTTQAVAVWGLALSLLALAACAVLVLLSGPDTWPVGALAALALVMAVGLAERYLALRLQFDAALFSALAQGRIGTLANLDAGLAGLGLRPMPNETRPLADRMAGALQLLRWHRSAAVLQTVLWLVAIGCLR